MSTVLAEKDVNFELKNLYEDIENIKSNIDIFEKLLNKQFDDELVFNQN